MKTMKKWQGFLVLLIMSACVAAMVYVSYLVIRDTVADEAAIEEKEKTEAETETTGTTAAAGEDMGIKLGLDLSGGVSVTYRIVDDNPSQEAVDDTISKLEERAATYNDENSVYQQGTDRIVVEIPGVQGADADRVLEDLGSPGSLYFIKETDADGNPNYMYTGAVEGGYELADTIENLIANGSVVMSGQEVKEATAGYQNSGALDNQEPVVQLTLTSDGTKKFADATTEAYAKGQTIGIYYDDHFISVPRVQAAITDGNCVITGMEDYDAANTLATFIRIGAIDLQLEELQFQVVGATLGSKALSTSLLAAGIGLLLVMAFMIIIYGISGVSASIALTLYTTIVVALLYLFRPAPGQGGIVLTLPGIAGVILGIGMAVDANVIIFARIREETAKGATVHTAIREGYRKALSAIVDGNITTFIAAVVLHFLGSGTVKGFANTLMISIVVSMFTALVIARLLMFSFFAVGVQDVKFYGKAKERKPLPIVEHRKAFFSISCIVIVAGIVGMIGFGAGTGKPLNYSIDFMGGSTTTADFGKVYTIDEIEQTIVPEVKQITGDNDVHANPVSGTTEITIRTRTLTDEERSQLDQLLASDFGVDLETIEGDTISSTVSSEMRRDAIIAVLVSCVFMLLYIWFRFKDFKTASSAILALVHDVLVVLTAYALIRISVGNTFIACMLTIVGYSINDTIVIFDRIRENRKALHNENPETLKELVNRSLTQTIGRSLNTSITTFIMVLMLFILGVASIREFALPLMVGFISGTYSSIFIAANLWYVMKTRKFKNQKTIEKK